MDIQEWCRFEYLFNGIKDSMFKGLQDADLSSVVFRTKWSTGMIARTSVTAQLSTAGDNAPAEEVPGSSMQEMEHVEEPVAGSKEKPDEQIQCLIEAEAGETPENLKLNVAKLKIKMSL